MQRFEEATSSEQFRRQPTSSNLCDASMVDFVFGMVASCQRQYVLSLECCHSHLGAHRWHCNLVSVLPSCNI